MEEKGSSKVSYTAIPQEQSSSPSSRSRRNGRVLLLAATASLALLYVYSSTSTLSSPPAVGHQGGFPSISELDELEHPRLGPLYYSSSPSGTQAAPPRIAIIGAGAAGASSAYFLKFFRDVHQTELRSMEGKTLNKSLEVVVTVFDERDYFGGRSTVAWPWNDDPEKDPNDHESTSSETYPVDPDEDPIEVGASIFVKANKNLQKAARIFNLTLLPHDGGEEEGSKGVSIWDGEEFRYQESNSRGWGWWDISKMLWRYGRSPLKVRTLVASTVSSFTSIYSPAFTSSGPYDSLLAYFNALDLTHPSTLYASDFFSSSSAGSINPLFTNDLIAAATAVNYGQSVHKIHALGALVSLAASGASKVKGGNRKIFEEFLYRSESNIRLGPEGGKVTELIKLDASKDKDGIDKSSPARAKWLVKTNGGKGGGTFDAVIIAAPFHQTEIKIVTPKTKPNVDSTHSFSHPPPQSYVKLHVTFIITNATNPYPHHFGQKASVKISKSVFSTFDTDSVHKPVFNSLNYLKALSPQTSRKFVKPGDEPSVFHVIKMFSSTPLKNSLIHELFGGEQNVGKVWEKCWFAYPELEPIVSERDLAKVRLDQGLYYVNGFERFISTMETETVSAFNTVTLLLKDLFGYKAPKSWAEWEAENETINTPRSM